MNRLEIIDEIHTAAEKVLDKTYRFKPSLVAACREMMSASQNMLHNSTENGASDRFRKSFRTAVPMLRAAGLVK